LSLHEGKLKKQQPILSDEQNMAKEGSGEEDLDLEQLEKVV
jgi:hypothetical protein